MEQDTSAYGIPCVRLSNPASIHQLLDHLRGRGHDAVDCLNTQPMNPIVQGRIESWQLWLAAHEADGELINEPVPLFASAVEQGYRATREALRSGRLRSRALLCVTSPTAVGAMRALEEAGRRVGDDVDVCAGDDALGMAEYLTPTLTCLRGPRVEPYIRACLNWFARGNGDWPGSLVMQPAQMPMFVGESTGGAEAEAEGTYVEEARPAAGHAEVLNE
jgi:DNA-binding LacI/PurR family transcriptional regulator